MNYRYISRLMGLTFNKIIMQEKLRRRLSYYYFWHWEATMEECTKIAVERRIEKQEQDRKLIFW